MVSPRHLPALDAARPARSRVRQASSALTRNLRSLGLALAALVFAALAVTGVAGADEATAADGADTVDVAASPLAGLGAVVPAANLRFAEAQRQLTDRAPTPPSACPAPEASFTDTWGAARSGGRAHKGVDMMAPYGSPVLAPVDGVVRVHSSGLGGLSYYLDGVDGNEYFGTHLATMTAEGPVSAGDQIGTVGTTGNASTPHLHFEVKIGGTRSVNPFPFAAQFCGGTSPS